MSEVQEDSPCADRGTKRKNDCCEEGDKKRAMEEVRGCLQTVLDKENISKEERKQDDSNVEKSKGCVESLSLPFFWPIQSDRDKFSDIPNDTEQEKESSSPPSHWSVPDDTDQLVDYSKQEGLAQEQAEVYCKEADEYGELAFPPSPEQEYEKSSSSDSDVSDDDVRMYGYQFEAYYRQQSIAMGMYAKEKLKEEPSRFTVKWRGPKDSNGLKNMRSQSNSFRRHEMYSDVTDNKALRPVYYRQFGGNAFGSHVQLYDVRKNTVLFNLVKRMTESHSICRLAHMMYEYHPSVMEHNCDSSTVDSTDAITSYAGLLAYLNIKDSFLSTHATFWRVPDNEDCITRQRLPMPEPLMLSLETELGYSRREIPHDAGVWGLLPLSVIRYNLWQMMYRLTASDDCTDMVHAGLRSVHHVSADTIFRAQSVYKAMTIDHTTYKDSGVTALYRKERAQHHHNLDDRETAAMMSRMEGVEKRKRLNQAFLPALHTCIQGLCMHFMQNCSLTEESQTTITESVIQWYGEEWSVYRCVGCDSKDMGSQCYNDMETTSMQERESHLGPGGCATINWILQLLKDIFEHEDVDGNDDEHEVCETIHSITTKIMNQFKMFEH